MVYQHTANGISMVSVYLLMAICIVIWARNPTNTQKLTHVMQCDHTHAFIYHVFTAENCTLELHFRFRLVFFRLLLLLFVLDMCLFVFRYVIYQIWVSIRMQHERVKSFEHQSRVKTFSFI